MTWKQHAQGLVVGALASVILGSCAFVAWRMTRLEEALQRRIVEGQEDMGTQRVEHSWQSGGETVGFFTVRGPSEAVPAWIERHDGVRTRMLGIYPKD